MNKFSLLPPGLGGPWLVPLFGCGSIRQPDDFLEYKSKSGSKIVPTGLDPVESMTFPDSWHVPFPREEILLDNRQNEFIMLSRSEWKKVGHKMRWNTNFIYPNANVTQSASDKQIFKHLSSEFVSVRRKVLSNGSIAPKAILSKQSEIKWNIR